MHKDYKSPTTPGLDIDFKNYVIELVCLNVDKKLGPKFWKNNTYWSNKYKREIKGFHNLKEHLIFSLDNPLVQKILIQIIKSKNIKSLSATKTIEKIRYHLKNHYTNEVNERSQIDIEENIKINMNKNSKFIDGNKKNKISSIRDMEK